MKTQWQHTKKIVRFLAVRERAVARFVVAGPPPLARRRKILLRSALLMSLAVFVLAPSLAGAAGVRARFDLDDQRGGPFPSDRFTVADASQNTGLRVTLPKPDCAVRPNDCANLDVINTLDGFNVQPRLSIPFDGSIDATSVTSQTVFLVSLGSTLPAGDPGGKVIGINQVVWDVATKTLHAESDEILDQHTRYALIVTRGVRDIDGDPVEVDEAFGDFRRGLNFGQTGHDPGMKGYRKGLLDGLAAARAAGVAESDVAVASVFTTQSVTAVLEKIRDQIKLGTPAPADFALGPAGTRAVYPLNALTDIVSVRQTRTAPSFSPIMSAFRALSLIEPGAVGTVAFGKYASPGLSDGRPVHPAGGNTAQHARRSGHERDLLQPGPAGGAPAGARVAGGNLRSRGSG